MRWLSGRSINRRDDDFEVDADGSESWREYKDRAETAELSKRETEGFSLKTSKFCPYDCTDLIYHVHIRR